MPKLDLAGTAPEGGDWVIKAHSPQRERGAITAFPLTMSHSALHGEPQEALGTAADSIAAAKRQLASYSVVSHATARRAIAAARAALNVVDTDAAESADSGKAAAALAGVRMRIAFHAARGAIFLPHAPDMA